MSVESQVVVIFATVNGFLDDIEIEKVKDFEKKLLEYMEEKNKSTLDTIAKEGDISKETDEKLKKQIEEFKKSL